MIRTSRAAQGMLRDVDHPRENEWRFRSGGIIEAGEARKQRDQMRREEEVRISRSVIVDPKIKPKVVGEKKDGKEGFNLLSDRRREKDAASRKFKKVRRQEQVNEPLEKWDRFPHQNNEAMALHIGKRVGAGVKKIYDDESHEWQNRISAFEGPHNLRHREARAVRQTGERAAAIVGQHKELPKRTAGTALEEKIVPPLEEKKPNPEKLTEREGMTFSDLLQAGWLELDGPAVSRLMERFNQKQAPYLEGSRQDVRFIRMQLQERLPTALACVNDRTDPEFGPVFAQLIKLVKGFFDRNVDEIKKFEPDFQLEGAVETALRDFVEDLIFRIAYFAELSSQADAWEKKHALRNAIDKLGDVEIPEYFKNLYGRSTRLTAQVDLLTHQVRDAAYTLWEHQSDARQEAKKAKNLEQKILREGLRQLTVEDLFPLFANGVDMSKVPGHERDIEQVSRRLANWQHPDSSSSMSSWGRMTPENAEKFHVLMKEILIRILSFYRRFAKGLKKVDERFISPENKLKKTLQYIFHYHYRTYSPGSYDSDSSSIISHFEDAVSKVAEAMYSTPLGDINLKLKDLRQQLGPASRMEKVALHKEIEEMEQLGREAKALQEYLYKVTSRAYSLTARVAEAA